MWDKNNEGGCGCGGMCMWSSASKEEKVAFLEKKEAKLNKMLSHIKEMKEAIASGKEIKSEAGGK
jgi:hypothetical protein